MKKMATAMAIGALVAATAATAALETVIKQKDRQFSQPDLMVQKGENVIFVNEDIVAHNIYVEFNSGVVGTGLQKPGEWAAVIFAEQGEFPVRCAIHPTMKMTVRVAE